MLFWLIAKKDFLLNLISARFVIGFLLCIVIIPFTVIVSVDNYLSQVQVYKIEQERAEKAYKEVRVWSALSPTVVSEPTVLSIFSTGISNNMGNKSQIKMREHQLFPSGHMISRDNPLLNAFFTIDFSKVVAILISLLALVFSYDAITREREEGTMKLTLTSRTSRITFLFGKLTGLLLTLLPILLFCYMLACLIIMFNPGISISASDWGGIMLLFFTSIIYMLVFLLIGMLISSLVSRSSSSIILSLICWIWFLFLLPNIATYLSQSFVKAPLYDNVENAMNDYDKEYMKGMSESFERIRKELNIENISYWNNNGDGFGYAEMSGVTKETALFHQRLSIWQADVLLNNADKKWILQKDYLDGLVRQQAWQQRIAWLSPSEIFGQTTNTLCRTDMQSFLKYMEQVRNYREVFYRFYADKKLIESFAYFTGHAFEDLYSQEEADNIEGGIWRLLDEQNVSNNMFPYLNTDEVPRFVSQPVTLATVLNSAMSRITALLGLMVALLIASIAAFMKYDVR